MNYQLIFGLAVFFAITPNCSAQAQRKFEFVQGKNGAWSRALPDEEAIEHALRLGACAGLDTRWENAGFAEITLGLTIEDVAVLSGLEFLDGQKEELKTVINEYKAVQRSGPSRLGGSSIFATRFLS